MENEFIYVKDLRIFNNVKMEEMIIIDNSVLSFAFQLENGIPILPFYDNPEDIELKFLSNYLGNIYNVKDLRLENIRSIKMLYFLNAVKEKEKGEEAEAADDLESSNFKIDLIKSSNKNNNNNNNEDENSGSFVLDSEGVSGSTGKNEPSSHNSNSMFKISLFSAEAASNNNLNNNNCNNSNDISQTSDNNDASYSNSENSYNDGYSNNYNFNSADITQKFFNNNSSSGNSYSMNSNSNTNSNNNNHYDKNINYSNVNNIKDPKIKSWENVKTEVGSHSKEKKFNRRNSTFQENLFSTLDDLKKTFSKLSEKKRVSSMLNNNN